MRADGAARAAVRWLTLAGQEPEGDGMQTERLEPGEVTVLDLGETFTVGSDGCPLKVEINRLLGQGQRRIVLNLERVTDLDSDEVAQLVSSAAAMRREGGDLKLSNVGARGRSLLSLARLLSVFDIYDHNEEAIRSFEP